MIKESGEIEDSGESIFYPKLALMVNSAWNLHLLQKNAKSVICKVHCMCQNGLEHLDCKKYEFTCHPKTEHAFVHPPLSSIESTIESTVNPQD